MVEDPSINRAAQACAADMARELAGAVTNGEQFFVARERIIARERAAMTARYGSATAERALAALSCIAPTDLPPEVQRNARDARLDRIEAARLESSGDVVRYRPLDRWLHRYFGFTLRGPELLMRGPPNHFERSMRARDAENERLARLRTAREETERKEAEALATQAKVLRQMAWLREQEAKGLTDEEIIARRLKGEGP